MSGFVGYTDYRHIYADSDDVLSDMLNSIIHRGPDGCITDRASGIQIGVRYHNTGNNFSSLPIIRYNNYIIAFDGTIYNEDELRNNLSQSNCSTEELLIRLFEQYGHSLPTQLRGMFSFVIYNTEDNSFFGARDPFGMKPLYYTIIDDNLIFASEIKALLHFPGYTADVNIAALEAYFSFRYPVMQETMFKGIFTLPPAHTFTYKNGIFNKARYWIPTFKTNNTKTLSTFTSEINSVLTASVDRHISKTDETGAFLASGVDSNYITALIKGDKGFSVNFDYDRCNDIDYIRDLADILKVDNHSSHVTTAQCLNALPDIIYHLDEPIADETIMATYFACKNASAQVNVVLSGAGADELFGGHNIYSEPMHNNAYNDLPATLRCVITKCADKLHSNSKLSHYSSFAHLPVEERYVGTFPAFSEKELNKLLINSSKDFNCKTITKPYYEDAKYIDDVAKMQYIDINFRLTNNTLLQYDKLGMAHSLEVRMPYLDLDVFDVARQLPTEFKINKVNNKYALRLAAQKYLPEAITRKKRTNRSTPIAAWLRNEKYYTVVREAFTSDVAGLFFNTDILVQYLEEHKTYKADNTHKIWTVYLFLVWYKVFFK